MPTAPDRIWTLNKVVPMYPDRYPPQRLRFSLPANKTYAAGQVVAENKANKGQADSISAVTAPPPAPATGTATTGGSLAAGTYGYKITGNTAGGETAPSPGFTQVVPAGTSTNTVTVTLPALPAGVTSYNVYGRTAGDERLLAARVAPGTYTDTGAAVPTAPVPAASKAFATPGLANFLGVLEYDAFTDASGNVFKGDSANPQGISTIGAAVWVGGAFNVADLVGLTADVLATMPGAHFVHGDFTSGVIAFGM